MRCKTFIMNALLAQLVEHLTLNQGVQGSSPWRRTKGSKTCVYAGFGTFFICVDRKWDGYSPEVSWRQMKALYILHESRL